MGRFAGIKKGLGGVKKSIGSGARKLRNRAGQFAFTGGRKGKKVKKGARGRLLKRYLTGTKRIGDKAGQKADKWMTNHPNMSNALFVATLAAGGLLGNRVGTAYADSQKKKK
jgi:hypothetical protein